VADASAGIATPTVSAAPARSKDARRGTCPKGLGQTVSIILIRLSQLIGKHLRRKR